MPEDVQHLREWGALQFGFEMGTGMRTYSPSALPHLALAAVVLVAAVPGRVRAGRRVRGGPAGDAAAVQRLERRRRLDDVWARAERVVRPVLALTCVGSLALVMLEP